MSLVTKGQLNIVLQSIIGLLSSKFDRSNVATDDDVLEFLVDMEYVEPVAASDNSIFTNSRGEIYTL